MVTDTIIKKGYKQTDLGVIPEDWGIEPIKQLATITTGSKNTQDRIPEGLYPFFVRSQTIERINSYSYDGEAVLTAGDGVGTGKVFHYINGKFDIHQRVYKISDFNKKLNGYFFFLYFSNNFFNRIMQMTAKSSVDSVRMEMIADMHIPVPTKPEQTAIATVLSDTDALIEHLEKLIAKKKAIKQGAMQQLLTGKRRLPGFSGEWEVRKLGEIGNCFAGGTPSTFKSEYWDGEHIWLPSGRVQNNILQRLEDEKTITQLGLDESAAKLIKPKSVLIAITGATCGNVGLLNFSASANQSVIAVEPNRETEYRFLFYSLLMKRSEILSNQTGSAQGGVNLGAIKKIEASFPLLEEQTAIAAILSDMDAEIESLEQKRDKYTMLKQGMMQQLLTGKIRIYAAN